MSEQVKGDKGGAKASPRTTRPTIKAASETPSADDLLKMAVTSAAPKPAELAPTMPVAPVSRFANLPKYAAVGVGALALGMAFGLLASPKSSSTEALAATQAAIEAGQSQTTRLSGDVAKLTEAVAMLRQAGETARDQQRAHGAAVLERLGGLEKGVDRKLALLSDTFDKAERDQTSALSALFEKRAALATPMAPPAPVAQPVRPEPQTTGTVVDTKPKSETIEGWAVRDVFAGMAVLEDRKRRLIEVGRGDIVPGIGKVEAVERRGRIWVVVTKQGLITPQTW